LSPSNAGQLVTGCNLDGGDERAIDRAFFCEYIVHPVHRVLYRFWGRQFQQHMNTLDDQCAILVFDLSFRVTLQLSVIDLDLARRQRAGKCAEESTGGSRDDVI